jgi:methionyl aminopeptidase
VSSFQIFNAAQISSLRTGGNILRETLEHAAASVQAGMTTGDLDRIAEEFILSHTGAKPAFKGYRGFPATLCTSVNEECVHGIPGPRKLCDGDIVSLDCGVIFDDLYTDACVTVAVGPIPPDVQKFLDVTSEALEQACAVVRKGAHVGDISETVQKYVEKRGYSVVKELTGHGLGRTLHQFPDVPNHGKRGTGPVFPLHTIIAIEPIIAMGAPEIRQEKDGWTLTMADKSLAAHFEHTVLITEDGCDILA